MARLLQAVLAAGALAATAAIAPVECSAAAGGDAAPPAPEFTQHSAQGWINSPPLSLADLRGDVVLLDIWAFDCWNCYRSFPWLKSLEERLGPRGLRVVGVHTPEFEHERVRASVERKVAEFALSHPVMIDNDFAYWKALGNRYWPTYYLVDREGRLRGHFVGETHADTPKARRIESAIEALLDE